MRRRFVLIAVLVGVIAAGTPSVASATCSTYGPRVTKKNAVGQVLYTLESSMYWCASHGNVYTASVGNLHPLYTRAFVDVVEVGSPVSRYEWYNGHKVFVSVRTAHVKNCAPIISVCKNYYPYIKARLMRDTTCCNGNPGLTAVLWRHAG